MSNEREAAFKQGQGAASQGLGVDPAIYTKPDVVQKEYLRGWHETEEKKKTAT